MRQIGIALVTASVVGVGAATAADLPRRGAPPPSPVYLPAPVYNWTGFYIGGNIGYGWARGSAAAFGASGSNDLDGIIGGGQLGYNWQTGNLLLGVEGDFQGSGQSRSDTVLGVTVDQDIPWFATVRGRIGYVNGPWAIYATGGAAWVDYKVTASLGGLSASSDTSKAAWTVGGGVEWMFVPQWSAKVEYLYIDTGNVSTTLIGVPVTGRVQDNIVRVGANYHF
jgi:outer membrane immunogenic protein